MVAKRETPPLSVDVSELLRAPGSGLRVTRASRIEGLGVSLAQVRPGSDIEIDLALDALVDAVHITGSVSAATQTRCGRCLTEIDDEIVVDVSEIAVYPDGDLEDEDAYPIVEGQLDLEPMIRDVIIEALPFAPLCRPDCNGLCPTCGADRNEIDCGHDRDPVDIRWAALDALRDRLEG